MTELSAQRRAARSTDGTSDPGTGDPDPVDDGPGGRSPLQLRLGTEDDLKHILYLIDDTARWLATRGTDQWQKPWPDRAARDERVRVGLAEGRTWTAWDCGTLVATITLQRRADPSLWPGARPDEAVYPCRLVVDREYAGSGLGAELMDWAGRAARDGYGARWVRIDVWTTNRALHRYYQRQGFTSRGEAEYSDSPAAALFEKPTAAIGASLCWPFEGEMPEPYKDAAALEPSALQALQRLQAGVAAAD